MFIFSQLCSPSANVFKNYKRSVMSVMLVSVLAGCATSPSFKEVVKDNISSEVTTYFEYNLQSPSGQDINLKRFVADIQDADVVLVGEWHTHTGIHRFQTELLQSMIADNDNVTLSMEQFTRDKQAIVNAYLAGEIGEGTLIKQGNAWPNYTSDYRPLVELAKANKIDIIAANAPKNIIRCIAKEGISYVDKLPADERTWLAANINIQDSPYKTHFMASMHHGDESQNDNKFASQVTWDETMAESIVNYLARNPNKQVMHIAGKFHTENGLGTAASILARAPELKVVIVTPVDVNAELTIAEKATSDYRLQVITPPKQFVKEANMMASFKGLSKRNDKLTCIE
ncbi:putative iron-regulated protein [Moritella sp. JT01]|uniref:ChaN family lipoprotein n=1 Tax=Moritella sp. JT01 TaxID=756698 RepID=UPI000799308C|nr:ChaN family lipoprotein [Moritella sp. JT01]KXO09497.1 putative iron-regulated protein [Moritella sp. JT01]